MFKVYDSQGHMFEISSSDKVRELIDKGWTPWHPENPPKLNNPETKDGKIVKVTVGRI
jgi:hypothetical protein